MKTFTPPLRQRIIHGIKHRTYPSCQTRNFIDFADHEAPTPPTVDLCPNPSCACIGTPKGLDIDYTTKINGLSPRYTEHVIVSTGHSDWPSKIEENPDDVGLFHKDLAMMIRPPARQSGTRRSGPYYNVGILYDPVPPMTTFNNKSPPPPPPPNHSRNLTNIPKTPISIYTFPSAHYITIPPCPDFQTYYHTLNDYIRGYALPKQIHPEYHDLAPEMVKLLTRDEKFRDGIPYRAKVHDAMVLICGHGNRDSRCGIMGPLIQSEFEEKLPLLDVELLTEPPRFHSTQEAARELHGAKMSSGAAGPNSSKVKTQNQRSERVGKMRARVGQISHIGGHKFAGNIIVYIPHTEVWKNHPLAGKGIWYGRVEPWHVEGIIEETIKKGNVIKELYRGAVDQYGADVWVPPIQMRARKF
ncbi:hypothetical protein EJ08DRAFT_593428 [Tothia fuscella]|uniref:Altered inheritance of mitochondria protein 32 n=1 Tax=Tothia fuscella TaxID=1048955 RepID=A0A9P4TW61_9PEZI|nr:hypothetical protein EJ08DRAFT_593428 [Tothia fuscella]